jgi:CubicO group peptidase (beta-lactamase class C family)
LAGREATVGELKVTCDPAEVGFDAGRLRRIDAHFAPYVDDGRLPGWLALVSRRGEIAHLSTYGSRDLASGAPVETDTLFRIYSMSKPVTSVAAMMLVEEGRIRLTDPVGMYLPQLAKLDVLVQTTDSSGKTSFTTVPAQRPVQVYDLLRHTSGLVYGSFTPNVRIKELYAEANVNWQGVTPQEQLASFAKVPLAHQPGTAWEYSMSTDIAGRVIEAVTGTPLSRFVDERVFKPLRMVDTTFHVPSQHVKRLAQPLATDKATGKPITLYDVTVAPKNDAGGAGAAGTAMDYARFLQMLANGGQLDGQRLLARATVRHMTSDHLGDIKPAMPTLPPGYGFGLGFAVRRADGLNGAPGSAGEFNWGGAGGTTFWVDPKEQLVAVLMTQAQPGPWQREFKELFRQLVYQAIVD